MGSRLGRPEGGLKQNREALMKFLEGELPPIRYSDSELAQKLKRGVRQIRRYLGQLKTENKIQVKRHRCKFDSRHWSNTRTITVTQEVS